MSQFFNGIHSWIGLTIEKVGVEEALFQQHKKARLRLQSETGFFYQKPSFSIHGSHCILVGITLAASNKILEVS